MKLVFCLVLIGCYSLMHAQNSTCNMDTLSQANYTQESSSSACGNRTNYSVYPDYNYTPIKNLRVAFDVIQQSNGGGYNGTDSEITQYFRDFIDSINIRLANLKILSPSVLSPHVVDSRIRFVLNNVYFYKSDELYTTVTTVKTACNDDSYCVAQRFITAINAIYSNVILARSDLSSVDKYNTLHLILVPALGDPLGGQAHGFSDKTWVVLKGYEGSFNWAASKAVSIHEQADHVIHEVGHSMGLYHNFQNGPSGSQCDDCADNGCPDEGTSNNYMDYHWRNQYSFSECQIAKMHWCLTGLYGNIVDDVVQDYCTFDNSQITINAGQNVIWNSAKNFLGDLIISGTLSANCRVSIPSGGKVIVTNGGGLTISQGDFHNICNYNWGGIEVQSAGYLSLNSTSVSDYNISIKTGGNLSIKNSLTLSGSSSIMVDEGVNITIDPNTKISSTSNSLSSIIVGAGKSLELNAVSLPNICVYVKASGNLSIKNTLALSGNSNITLDEGANITIDSNTQITSTTNSQAKIIVGTGKSLVLDGVSLSNVGISVKAGGNLSVKNSLALSGNSTINIEEGASLTINPGTQITSSSTSQSKIVLGSGKYLELNGVNIPSMNIYVKPSGTLRILNTVNVSGGSIMNIESGAYFCIEQGASITLTNINDAIDLLPGYVNGVNPSLSISSNCVANPATFAVQGSGSIHSNFDSDVYIQNQTLSGNQYITGRNIYVGENVTSIQPQGAVYIANGATIVFHAAQDVNMYDGFNVQTGGTYEIK